MSNNRLDHIINSAIFNHYVFSKVNFDNAKDVGDLIQASNQNHQVLEETIMYRVKSQTDQLLAEKFENSLDKGKLVMRLNGKLYEIKEL